ncbi:hypothetical protein GCM10022297_00990 [Lactobacillus hamsteri]|uniref:phage holin family protein n=1 Tax=Lactobacillus hamsteri TaxID=96565 RepID=UPI0004695ECA|nr:phage holin family protein [Lactobacillus hamsteri]
MIEVASSYHNELLEQYTHLIDDKWFWAFTIVVLLDLILDLIKPWVIKTDERKNWFKPQSVLRNAVTYAVVAVGYPYLFTIGAQTAATAFLIAFIYQYLVWVIETWTEVGWWLPEPIIKFVKAQWSTSNKKLDDTINRKEDDQNVKNG